MEKVGKKYKKAGYFLARTSGCVLKVWVLNFVKLAAAVFSGRTTKDTISDIEAAQITIFGSAPRKTTAASFKKFKTHTFKTQPLVLAEKYPVFFFSYFF